MRLFQSLLLVYHSFKPEVAALNTMKTPHYLINLYFQHSCCNKQPSCTVMHSIQSPGGECMTCNNNIYFYLLFLMLIHESTCHTYCFFCVVQPQMVTLQFLIHIQWGMSVQRSFAHLSIKDEMCIFSYSYQ